jgi:hypothetical protein
LKLGDVATERRKELQTVSLGALIEWYRQDRTSDIHKRKRSFANEDIVLQAFLNRESTCAGSRLQSFGKGISLTTLIVASVRASRHQQCGGKSIQFGISSRLRDWNAIFRHPICFEE